MTGREAWVKMGLDLGADVYLACLLEVAAEKGLHEITSDEFPELLAEVSRRFQKRWPAWKVEATKARELALETPCAKCGRTGCVVVGSAYGPVCLRCMDAIIFDRKEARGE